MDNLSESPATREVHADLLLVLAVLAAHTFAIQGYSAAFSGDFGRWAHEVDRFAAGQLPYRDFQWHFPPLAMWIVGGAARLIGSDLSALAIITGSLTALIAVTFVRLSRDILGRSEALIDASCLVLAFAYAQILGAPLALGFYTPAAPVGGLCILFAAHHFVRSATNDSGRDARWMALWAGLAVLSKQDFWIPAAYLVGVNVIRSRRIAPLVISAIVVAIGAAVIAATAGVAVMVPLIGGFGHTEVFGAEGFPSWERLTVDALTVSLLCGAGAALASIARRRLSVRPILVSGAVAVVLIIVYVLAADRTAMQIGSGPLTATQVALRDYVQHGYPLWQPTLHLIRQRVFEVPLPVSLSPVLLVALWIRRDSLPPARLALTAMLLGLTVALKVRRAFAGSEWFEFLVTLPVALASLELLFSLSATESRRLRLVAGGVLTLWAAVAYAVFGRGPGTLNQFAAATTLRGTVHWHPKRLHNYQTILAVLDSIDPARERPLIAFGYTGGFNYFLKRRNPLPMTQDFFFSAFDADSVLQQRPARVFLIDNPNFWTATAGAATFDVRAWEQPRKTTPYPVFDRPRFQRLLAGCAPIASAQSDFLLFDCP